MNHLLESFRDHWKPTGPGAGPGGLEMNFFSGPKEPSGVTKTFQTWRNTELSSQEFGSVESAEATEFCEIIFILA